MRTEPILWAGGEHVFAFPIHPENTLAALESRCEGDGVGLIFYRLANSIEKQSDVFETLIIGLHGGGMDKVEARQLVNKLFEDYGLRKLRLTAYAVLNVAMHGWPVEEPEDDEGKSKVETSKTSK